MKRRRLGPELLLLLPFIWAVLLVVDSIAAFQSLQTIDNDNHGLQRLQRSPGRSLMSLPPERNTTLIAGIDGTVYLVDNNSKKVMWSFSSGPPIYSAYQHNQIFSSSSFYIDCGDDWELYLHYRGNLTLKLPHPIEEFLKNTPYLSEDGAVTLGSKKTTVFEVDPKIGRLIRSYVSSDSAPELEGSEDESKTGLVQSGSNDPNPAEPSLKIMRTDYTLKSFIPDSDKVSWNVTVAEIVAALLCEGLDKDIALPLPCQSKESVFRHRSRVLLESVRPDGLLGVRDRDTTIRLRSPVLMLPAQSKLDVHQQNKTDQKLHSPPVETNDSNLQDEQNGRVQQHRHYALSIWLGWSIALTVGVCIGIVVHHRYAQLIKGKVLPNEQSRDSDSKASSSKKKKNRKLNKRNDSLDLTKGDGKMWSDLNKPVDRGVVDGRWIGNLFVTNVEIAKGSNGTIVLEGRRDGRVVAVKRLVRAHHDVALKEIQNLIASDYHPNIVRWFGVENDEDFVYVSLELCTCSLENLIQFFSDSCKDQVSGKDHPMRASAELKVRLESITNSMPTVYLWKADGHPSPLLLKLMRDIVAGVAHLHQLGIIHRDLKPQNVLITKDTPLCAKLSDMGISKRLHGDVSSLGQQVTGCGSPGWQAPEQLLDGRQTRAVDLFSLGCVIFYCVTGGRHPFGARLERDSNITKNCVDLSLVECFPEALELISGLLNPDPELRPKAVEVLYHPLFWDSETRLSFLRDTSDRVELEDRENGSGLLNALESIAFLALGSKWNEKMEPAFIANIGRYRRYKYDSVRDLLRVMRNKLSHYRELPKEIQELVGAVPDGFDSYFASRFPRLLIEVYKVIITHCKEEEWFRKYCKSNNMAQLS